MLFGNPYYSPILNDATCWICAFSALRFHSLDLVYRLNHKVVILFVRFGHESVSLFHIR